MSAGVEAVLEVLMAAGFEQLPKPLVVAGATFDFDAAVKGTGVSHDLVVVASAKSDVMRLGRLLAGLSRTLDHVASRRPVTLVLVGQGDLDAEVKTSLELSARVLLVPRDEPTATEVTGAVAVLLPLHLPAAASGGKDPLAEVAHTLGRSKTSEHDQLIAAARNGPEAVRRRLRQYIDGAIAASRKEDEE